MTPETELPGGVLFVGPILGHHAGRIPSPAEALADRFENEGTKVFLTSGRKNPLGRAAEMVRDIATLRRVVEVAVILVYSGRSFLYSRLCSRLCGLVGLPMVFWLHGGGLPRLAAAEPALLRRVLERGRTLVVPSPFLTREIGDLDIEITVIPNLIDLESHPYRERSAPRPTLLWMRSFVPHCRPELAVRTLAEVRRSQPEARLTMAGPDQGSLDATRRLTEELGLADGVDFAGFVSGSDKAALLDEHDIYLHTNSVDNAPISLLEAAACGLAIVACDVGGVADLLRGGRAGLLSRDSTPEDLARLISEVLDRPEEARHRSRNALTIAQESSWPATRSLWAAALRPEEGPAAGNL